MKILLVQDYLRSGGTERQSVLLANAFAANGHSTALLTFRPGGPLDGTVAPAVHRIALQKKGTSFDWLAPSLTSTAQELAPDIILCMGRMANCYAGRLQNRCPQATVIATMRTGKSLPWLFRRSLQRTRHVIANSHQARAALIERYRVNADKVTVIHNSLVFPENTALQRDNALRAKHGATSATTILLCVAMFRPEKNQRELIETVASLPQDLDCQLWLAGDGPVQNACKQLAAARNLSSRVLFTGFQRDPSVLYAAADIAVHASTSESLSNFLIEAQAHGLPAVAYAAQGISETFRPGETGWEIPRGDRVAFCQRIARLASDTENVRMARAANARAFARATFDSAGQVAKYLELFVQFT